MSRCCTPFIHITILFGVLSVAACFDLGKAPQSVCGDGDIGSGETCDDGNATSGDGCDELCQTEPAICGDGNITAGETCDDGNTTPGDGCSELCQIQCSAAVMSQAALDFCNAALNANVDPSDCQDTGSTPANFCDVKFRAEVMPIMTTTQTCGNTASCHGNTFAAPQGFQVSAADATLTLQNMLAPSTEFETGTPLNRVEPSDPQASYLVHKLLGTQNDVGGAGLRMPFLQDQLCPDDIAAVCFWVAAGAQDN